MAKNKNQEPLEVTPIPKAFVGDMKGFNALNEALSKISPDGGILDESIYARIDEWIPTGSYILNAALSGSLFGGMPNRRSLGLAGVESTAKTYISLMICRSAQSMGYFPVYVDTEGSIDIDFVSRLGVDPKRFRIEPIGTIEQLSHFAATINGHVESIKQKGEIPPKIIFVIDSLGNLSSEKETEDTQNDSNKRDMTKQQNVRKFFRVNGLRFAKNAIPLIVVGHVYDAIGSYVPTKEISGGGGLKYNVSVIFMLTKSKLEDKEGEQAAKDKNINAVRLGVTITVTPVKQRFARPIKVQLHIPFYKKPNPFVGLESFVSWDACGIMRGKIISEKDYHKLLPKEQKDCRELIIEGKKHYAMPKDTARSLVCKHLNGEVPLAELFTEKVFTMEVLKQLDENVIKPTFMLPDIESLDDLAEITEELEVSKIDENSVVEEDTTLSNFMNNADDPLMEHFKE
jgi:RecA/RadA recombinase